MFFMIFCKKNGENTFSPYIKLFNFFFLFFCMPEGDLKQPCLITEKIKCCIFYSCITRSVGDVTVIHAILLRAEIR